MPKKLLFDEQKPPWPPMSGNMRSIAEKPASSDTNYFYMMPTEVLLDIMLSDTSTKKERIAACEIVKERLRPLGVSAL